jgi:hypothetical protein
MPQGRSKYEFRQQASLSQKLAHKNPEYIEYAGADPKTSLAIMALKMFHKHGLIKLDEGLYPLLMDLLDGERKVRFATSDKVNEITKMGLQMPKSPSEVDMSETG